MYIRMSAIQITVLKCVGRLNRLLGSWQRKAALLVVLLSMIFASVAFWYYDSALSRPRQFGAQPFLVAHGESLTAIAERLVNNRVIDEPYSLRIHARLNGLGTRIKAGEYRLPDDLSLVQFMRRLVSGKGQIGIKITIIEGWTFKQMRAFINAAPKLKKTTLHWSNKQIMQEMGSPELHPEGQFYPETYHYRSGDSDISVYKEAFALMQKNLDSIWMNRADNLQIKNRYQALILASIIEKETYDREEQPHIAGVFDNRLRIGMRLQTDPTVIYGLGSEYNGNITRKHLKTDTPYNTYTRAGLPPTPISLPGHDSLYAAVHPKKTKSLYFVAKGGGKHKFSATLKEHNKAVRKYILRKK